MPRSRARQKREAKLRRVSVPEPWVCWKNNKLDFREHYRSFTIEATKRIEAILIHHYGLEEQCGGKELSLYCIIKMVEDNLSAGVVEKLHEFRKMRNRLVHLHESVQLGEAERSQFINDILSILKSLNKGCNCKETYSNIFRLKTAERFREVIILPDSELATHSVNIETQTSFVLESSELKKIKTGQSWRKLFNGCFS